MPEIKNWTHRYQQWTGQSKVVVMFRHFNGVLIGKAAKEVWPLHELKPHLSVLVVICTTDRRRLTQSKPKDAKAGRDRGTATMQDIHLSRTEMGM